MTYVAESRVPYRSPRGITHAETAFHLLAPVFRRVGKRERFVALYLNARNVPIGRPYVVSIGTLDSSIVHARDVFAPAFRRNAAGLIVAHNHPSGDPTPSDDDWAVTDRLREVAKLMGFRLLDSIVIGALDPPCYVSMAESWRILA